MSYVAVRVKKDQQPPSAGIESTRRTADMTAFTTGLFDRFISLLADMQAIIPKMIRRRKARQLVTVARIVSALMSSSHRIVDV